MGRRAADVYRAGSKEVQVCLLVRISGAIIRPTTLVSWSV